ncbi:UNVERIFIED_CONTAM: hypothetical protein K2H54_048364 [Gekko kuhli]
MPSPFLLCCSWQGWLMLLESIRAGERDMDFGDFSVRDAGLVMELLPEFLVKVHVASEPEDLFPLHCGLLRVLGMDRLSEEHPRNMVALSWRGNLLSGECQVT